MNIFKDNPWRVEEMKNVYLIRDSKDNPIFSLPKHMEFEYKGRILTTGAVWSQDKTDSEIKDVADEIVEFVNGYNGWTNKETWTIATWIIDSHEFHNCADSAEDLKEFTKLKFYIESPNLEKNMWDDLMVLMLDSRINWNELWDNESIWDIVKR